MTRLDLLLLSAGKDNFNFEIKCIENLAAIQKEIFFDLLAFANKQRPSWLNEIAKKEQKGGFSGLVWVLNDCLKVVSSESIKPSMRALFDALIWKDAQGKSSLDYAALYYEKPFFEKLIDVLKELPFWDLLFSANLIAKPSMYGSLIYMSAKYQSKDGFVYLVQKLDQSQGEILSNALNKSDEDGNTSLHKAAYTHDSYYFQLLMTALMQSSIADHLCTSTFFNQNRTGQTFYHRAASLQSTGGFAYLVECLSKQHIGVLERLFKFNDWYGNSPLHEVAYASSVIGQEGYMSQILMKLMSYDELDPKVLGKILFLRNLEGKTPLDIVCEQLDQYLFSDLIIYFCDQMACVDLNRNIVQAALGEVFMLLKQYKLVTLAILKLAKECVKGRSVNMRLSVLSDFVMEKVESICSNDHALLGQAALSFFFEKNDASLEKSTVITSDIKNDRINEMSRCLSQAISVLEPSGPGPLQDGIELMSIKSIGPAPACN